MCCINPGLHQCERAFGGTRAFEPMSKQIMAVARPGNNAYWSRQEKEINGVGPNIVCLKAGILAAQKSQALRIF